MLFLLVFFSINISAEETLIENYEGTITSNSVQPPYGAFLLIRNKESICAIKFIEAWQGNDQTNATTWHSGDESTRSLYLWYLGEEINNNWILHPPKSSGKSEVSSGKLYGIGRLAFGGSNIFIKCGSIKVQWTSPANVLFFHGPKQKEEGNEIAITKWEKFEDVNPNDPSLEWVKFSKNHPRLIMER